MEKEGVDLDIQEIEGLLKTEKKRFLIKQR